VGGSLLGAKKKPPERLRPRGAEDTTLFRERLDGSRWQPEAWHLEDRRPWEEAANGIEPLLNHNHQVC